jgi:hypothetical protein
LDLIAEIAEKQAFAALPDRTVATGPLRPQGEAREIVRSMVDRVVLTPRANGRGLDATLFSDLAPPLSVCAEISGDKKPSAARPAEGQPSMAAGPAATLTERSSCTDPRPNSGLRPFDLTKGLHLLFPSSSCARSRGRRSPARRIKGLLCDAHNT